MSDDWTEERVKIEELTRKIFEIEDKKSEFSAACNDKIKTCKAEIKALLDAIDGGGGKQANMFEDRAVSG